MSLSRLFGWKIRRTKGRKEEDGVQLTNAILILQRRLSTQRITLGRTQVVHFDDNASRVWRHGRSTCVLRRGQGVTFSAGRARAGSRAGSV